LRCVWCHNPESWNGGPELFYDAAKCIGCGRCVQVCPEQCHTLINGIHNIDRTRCTGCGQCALECCSQALRMVGQTVDVVKLMAEIRQDRIYYEKSGGGLTVSGGEPLAQPEFTRALLQAAKAEKIQCCLDTSGYADWETLASMMPYTDIFLYDIKETDSDRHRQYTGVSLEPILENLRRLDAAGATTIIRVPIIPGMNDRSEHRRAVEAIVAQLKHCLKLEFLSYHPLGKSKLKLLGKGTKK